jgi:ABC-type Fe3+/spermidine/putrescine transport system ATPase subunit
VARFLGLNNLLVGRVIAVESGELQLETPLGRLPTPSLGLKPGKTWQPGQVVSVLLRPDAVELGQDGPCRVQGVVTEIIFRGGLSRASVTANGISLNFDFLSRQDLPAVGEPVCLAFDPSQALQVLDEGGDAPSQPL